MSVTQVLFLFLWVFLPFLAHLLQDCFHPELGSPSGLKWALIGSQKLEQILESPGPDWLICSSSHWPALGHAPIPELTSVAGSMGYIDRPKKILSKWD